MNILKKTDLIYNYEWSAYGNDDPKVTGKPDSTMLNRKEGYEVLYLINKFMRNNGLSDKLTAIIIEEMIYEELPGEIRSQKNVTNWIEKNLEDYL